MDGHQHTRWNRIPVWLAGLGLIVLMLVCPAAALAWDDTACAIYDYG